MVISYASSVCPEDLCIFRGKFPDESRGIVFDEADQKIAAQPVLVRFRFGAGGLRDGRFADDRACVEETQEKESADAAYTPPFDLTGV